jgi:hypothetical protein
MTSDIYFSKKLGHRNFERREFTSLNMAGKFEHLYQTAPDCSRSLGAFIALETDGGGA